jgi:putative membrane protein
VAIVIAAVLVFRLLSAIWSSIKHFDFSLTVRGAELFQSYGLLTRVGRTIPRARIQKLTIADDPLMRRLARATVSVETAASAGGEAAQSGLGGSQVLVPIVKSPRLAPLVREVYPTGAAADLADLDALEWQPVDRRAFSRLARGRTAFAVVAGACLAVGVGWWAWLAALAVGSWLLLLARIETRITSFAWAGETLVFRSSNGWTRRISLVRSGRAQVVSLTRSPLDRRWRMAGVRVDTAGAAGAGHHVHVPWLSEAVAAALYARLRRTMAAS